MSNSLSATLLTTLAGVSVQAGVFALIVWMISRIVRKAPAAWKAWLWLFVFVKFLIPPFVNVPYHGPILYSPQSINNTLPAIQPSAPQKNIQDITQLPVVPVPANHEIQVNTTHHIKWQEIAAILWLTGVAMMAVMLLIRVNKQRRIVSRCLAPSNHIEDILADCVQKAGIKKIPCIRISPEVQAPMLTGFLKPIILLPQTIADTCSDSDLSAILLHELAHIQRHDMIGIWIQELVRIFFYFHPMLWIAGREIEKERELACDAFVLSLPGITRQVYASGYLQALRFANTRHTSVALSMTEPLNMEKSRLKKILSGSHGKLTRRWIVILIIILAVGLPMLQVREARHSSNKAGWDSISTTLPNGLGTIVLQQRSSNPPSILPVPGTEQRWRVQIYTGPHEPYEIKIGDVIDYSTNLEVFLISNGKTNVIRLTIDDKNIYYDLTLGKEVSGIYQEGKKLGAFYDSEFVPQYAEHPKVNGGLFSPYAIAVAGDGSVYVIDSTYSLIIKYTENGQYITKWNINELIPSDKYATGYYGVTVDNNGYVWVINTNGSLKKYDANGQELNTFNTTDNNSSTYRFKGARGITVDKESNIYMTVGSQIQKVAPNGKTIFMTLGKGYGSSGISVTSDGHVLAANDDRGIENYTTDGKLVATWGKVRHRWSENDYPADVKADDTGNIYVAAVDHSEMFIEKYTSGGKLLLRWNSGVDVKDGGPVNIAVDKDSVYIADANNHRVLKFTNTGKLIPNWGR
ncbi:MAG: M56 family metallopeptidase [Armatimonadota bacterium]